MRYLLPMMVLCFLPLAAGAQNHSNAPLLAVSNGDVVQPATTAPVAATIAPEPTPAINFPAAAVTAITRNATGQIIGSPIPAAGSPAAPNAPLTKLWPVDTVPIFMQSCMKFHVELAQPCNCIITGVMQKMHHDEFVQLSQAGTLAQDPRILAVQTDCSTQPRQRAQGQ